MRWENQAWLGSQTNSVLPYWRQMTPKPAPAASFCSFQPCQTCAYGVRFVLAGAELPWTEEVVQCRQCQAARPEQEQAGAAPQGWQQRDGMGWDGKPSLLGGSSCFHYLLPVPGSAWLWCSSPVVLSAAAARLGVLPLPGSILPVWKAILCPSELGRSRVTAGSSSCCAGQLPAQC